MYIMYSIVNKCLYDTLQYIATIVWGRKFAYLFPTQIDFILTKFVAYEYRFLVAFNNL